MMSSIRMEAVLNDSLKREMEVLRLLEARAQLPEFNKELDRRLAALDRGEFVDPNEARARLQRNSDERRKKRA